MTSRDEWFAIHAAGPGESALTKPSGPQRLGGHFRVAPEAAPAIRAAFEEAIQEMYEASKAMRQMRYVGSESVNPVVDRYLAALAEVGYGDQGSVTMAAETATAAYQNVIDQLDRVMADYQDNDASGAVQYERLRP